MKLHSLSNTYKRKARKRVGRGHGNNWGRTGGRGEKGQKSRSGSSIRPHFEGGQITFFRRLPKKGFKSPDSTVYTVVNVATLDRHFEAGDSVDIDVLAQKGLIGAKLGSGLKILGNGEISKKLTVKAHAFSGSAQSKIEAAGGTCESI